MNLFEKELDSKTKEAEKILEENEEEINKRKKNMKVVLEINERNK